MLLRIENIPSLTQSSTAFPLMEGMRNVLEPFPNTFGQVPVNTKSEHTENQREYSWKIAAEHLGAPLNQLFLKWGDLCAVLKPALWPWGRLWDNRMWLSFSRVSRSFPSSPDLKLSTKLTSVRTSYLSSPTSSVSTASGFDIIKGKIKRIFRKHHSTASRIYGVKRKVFAVVVTLALQWNPVWQ